MVKTQTSRKPFNVGDRVSVIRTNHGWYDGALCAVVQERSQRKTGTYFYQVLGEDGSQYHVNHTRDLNLSR